MNSVQHHSTFGRPLQPHTVIISRGESLRHFTVKPWMLAISTVLASALVVGTLGAAGYLLLHDDIVASTGARQARLQQAYEDRIATLRSQLDRVVSRQLLDQQTVETKVDTLIGQQAQLAARYDKLQPLLERARASGLVPATVPVPQPKPTDERAALASDAAPVLAFGDPQPTSALDRFAIVDRSAAGRLGSLASPGATGLGTNPHVPDATTGGLSRGDLIREIRQSIDSAEDGQLEGLASLAESAREKAAGIASVLQVEGIRFPAMSKARSGASEAGGQGGPFVEVPDNLLFEARFHDLDAALTALQAIRTTTGQLPLAAPVTAAPVSSTFGVRADPFLGRSAMHTGIDFVALTGTVANATAAGTVVQASLNGGYGNMVEIDHGGGVSTRYAHLSAVLVSVGDKVAAGDTIGKVGSTGRSTGPHLHYEVRLEGNAVDPARFLRAGRKIEALG